MLDAPKETLGYAGWKDGEIIDVDPVRGTRRVYRDIDDKHGAIVTEYMLMNELKDFNAAQRSDAAGKAWGEGQTVGRIPLHILTDPNMGLLEAVRVKDDAFIRKFLNDNPALKTRDKI